MPDEVLGFSWGGFFIPLLWGVFNRVWISLLWLFPIIGPLVMPFVLGFKGREWAWKAKEWKSVKEFQETQKNWGIAGIILTIIAFFVIPPLFAVLFAMNSLVRTMFTSTNSSMQIEKAQESSIIMDAGMAQQALKNYQMVNKGYPFRARTGEKVEAGMFADELVKSQFIKANLAGRIREKGMYAVVVSENMGDVVVCYPSVLEKQDKCVPAALAPQTPPNME